MTKHSIPETDILIETIFWLIKNNWTIDAVSFPRGQEMNSNDHHSYFKYRLEETSQSHIINKITFPSNGPDILANKDAKRWKIECKGYSDSKSQTQRTNFDRQALWVTSIKLKVN